MPNSERLHIGHLIKTVFDESGMTVAEFARRIHCARPNMYSIFERYDIGVEQLVKVSIALNHNFLEDIQQHFELKNELLPNCLNLSQKPHGLTIDQTQRIINLFNELSKCLFSCDVCIYFIVLHCYNTWVRT